MDRYEDNMDFDDIMDELMSDAQSTISELPVHEESEHTNVHEEVVEVESVDDNIEVEVVPKRRSLFGSAPISNQEVAPIVVSVDEDPLIHEEEIIEEIQVVAEVVPEVTSNNIADDLLDSLMEDYDDTPNSIHEMTDDKLAFNDNAYDIVVSPDGKKLSELVPSMRKGSRSFNKMIEDIKDDTKSIEVDGVTYADNRYIKGAKSIEDKSNYNEERKKLSNKFLQRNSKFTEHEKIIMENLGVSNEQFTDIMRKGKLTKSQQEAILVQGKYGAEKLFKGRRYRTTIGDKALLEFLTIFKFANTNALRWLQDESPSRTWRKLNRLRENGLVNNTTILGMPDLWGATNAGIALSGYDLKPGLSPKPKMYTISATAGVNYLAACLWFNTVNVLNLDDFPASNRLTNSAEGPEQKVRGEELVSELQLRSTLGKLIHPKGRVHKNRGDQKVYDFIAAEVRGEIRDWRDSGMQGPSPELHPGNEHMWILYPQNELTMTYHVPDLVVKRDRNPDGTPNSIAVELERISKNNNSYEKIMRAYKLDKHLYKKVIWVTPNAQVAKQLQAAAEAVGFENYDIVPIITKGGGTYTGSDIWMI